MGRINAVLLAVLVAWAPALAAQDLAEQQALARQIERRFDVLPAQGGVMLRPKTPMRDVRSIQLIDGAIAIDGEPVTGAELRQRLDADADSIIRLSYLDAAAQRALFAPPPTSRPAPAAGDPAPAPPAAPASPASPETPSAPTPPQTPEPNPRPRGGRSNGDRVRIGGSVEVGPNEVVNGDVAAIGGNSTVRGQVLGDVVAIGGTATIDGPVRGDVVSVGGGTTLGPQAEINGDVVVVGGALRRDPAARINGEVKEIGLGEINFWPGFRPSLDGARGAFFGAAMGSLFAFVATLTRLAVMCILASIVLLFARDYVERIGVRAATEPVKAGAIGLLIQLLFLPVLIASIVLMVITIIGIPLLLLVPFGILAAVLLALVGFTAVAYDVGRFAVNRLGAAAYSPYVIAAIGIALVLSPLLLSRLLGFAGGFLWPVAWALLLIGLCAEYVAWTIGLGAIALVRFDRKAVVIQP
jgi:hypothetical protein